MAWETTTDRALMLGEFSGDGDAYVLATAASDAAMDLTVGETGVAKSVTITGTGLISGGAMRLTIERPAPSRTDLQTCLTSDATLTVSGTDSSVTATFTPNAAVLAQKQDLNYAFRHVTSGRVLKSGRVAVSYKANVDA